MVFTVPSEFISFSNNAINAVDTHAKFMALYDTPVDSNGEPTGVAPINDWPDEI